jgi:acetylornithine deacetylase/succinyl-diaminopimelate desuccinylase-like protein
VKPDPASIRHAVDARRDDLASLAQAFVRAPSLPDHEHEVQELVARRLRGMGLEGSVIIPRSAMTGSRPTGGSMS